MTKEMNEAIHFVLNADDDPSVAKSVMDKAVEEFKVNKNTLRVRVYAIRYFELQQLFKEGLVNPAKARSVHEDLRKSEGKMPLPGSPSWSKARASLIEGIAFEPIIERKAAKVELAPEVSDLLQAFIDHPNVDALHSVVSKLSSLRGD